MYLFGKKALIENIKNFNLIKVFLFKPSSEILFLVQNNNIKYEILSDLSFFNNFDRNLNHQNIVIKLKDNFERTNFKEFLLQNKNNEKLLILILDQIEDPHNLGAIFRTAEGFGVNAIIYKKNNQAKINEFVIKTSMGAIANLNLFRVPNLINEINLLKKHGFWIYSSCLNEKSTDYSKIKYDNKTALIIGNENTGISKLVLNNSDFFVKIPMYGKIQSFNVSVSAGILLSEIKKQIK